jgi:hypothetical protein
MQDWEGSYTSGGGLTPPSHKKPSMKALSVVSVVVLTVGVVAGVIAAQQSTEQRSRAYDGGSYGGGSYGGGSTATPTPVPSSSGGTIVDNISAIVVGSWDSASSALGHYGNDYRYTSPGSGSSYVQYVANVSNTGQYDVYEWHSQGTNRTTAAKHVVTYSGGSQTISVNQQNNGGKWNLLGRYTFAQGNSGNVKITNSFSGYNDVVVIADAIKFVFVGGLPTATPIPGSTCNFFNGCAGSPTPTPIKTPTPTSGGIGGFPTAIPTAIPTSTPTPTPIPATPTPVPTAIPTAVPTPIIPTSTPIPTAAITPGSTTLALNLGLQGIGKGGDSSNPEAQGTLNPLHPQRSVSVQVYNSQNQLVADKAGTVTYDIESGLFNGQISLGTSILTGSYTVKVKSDQYLRTLIPGIQTITSGSINTLASASLRSGDINGDNQINIVDYTILMGCYSDLLPATDCTGNNAALSDLTDDGHVNQIDYNFFLRQMSSVEGI